MNAGDTEISGNANIAIYLIVSNQRLQKNIKNGISGALCVIPLSHRSRQMMREVRKSVRAGKHQCARV